MTGNFMGGAWGCLVFRAGLLPGVAGQRQVVRVKLGIVDSETVEYTVQEWTTESSSCWPTESELRYDQASALLLVHRPLFESDDRYD